MIVRFVNRKSFYAALSKKLDLQHFDKVSLGFPEANLFFNENLTPYNQKLAWKCRELKCAGKIHSTWSSKWVIKLRRTMNERAISIEDEIELSNLYPEFPSRERDKNKLESRYFILSNFVSVFILVFMLPLYSSCGDHLVNLL